MKCTICKDHGYLEDGRKCNCVLQEELLNYLPIEVEKSIPSKSVRSNYIVYDVSVALFMPIDKSSYLSKVKAFLALKYILSGGNFKYSIHTGTSIIDKYVTGEGLMDLSGEIHFLSIELGHDPQNKAMLPVLDFIINQRIQKGLYTWVYIDKSKVNQISSLYGKDLHNLLNSDLFKRVNI